MFVSRHWQEEKKMISSNPFNVGIIKISRNVSIVLQEIENPCLHPLPSNQSKIRCGFQSQLCHDDILPQGIIIKHNAGNIPLSRWRWMKDGEDAFQNQHRFSPTRSECCARPSCNSKEVNLVGGNLLPFSCFLRGLLLTGPQGAALARKPLTCPSFPSLVPLQFSSAFNKAGDILFPPPCSIPNPMKPQ